MNAMIIAHRGESFDAPENTMSAISLAWDRGADAVEIDVQLSKDNKVVVIHDANTNRLGSINKKVKDQTAAELKKLDVGSWKHPKWKGECIPLIKEVLDSVPGSNLPTRKAGKLIIEIKSDAKIIPYLRAEIERSKLKVDQIEFIGFDLNTMIVVKQTFLNYKVLWLLDLDYNWLNRIFQPSISKAIAKAKNHTLDGLNVWAGNMLDKNIIEQVHASGLLLYCWTVNDIEKARWLMKCGIDAITTDRAAWLGKQLID